MVLQNPFPATHVFSQLSALLPGCHLPLPPPPPFRHGAHNPLAPISQLPSLQWLADSLSLLPLFCAGAPFIFNRLQTLLAKHGGWWGVPHSRDSAQLGAFCPRRNLFAPCSCTLYPQSRLHPRF